MTEVVTVPGAHKRHLKTDSLQLRPSAQRNQRLRFFLSALEEFGGGCFDTTTPSLETWISNHLEQSATFESKIGTIQSLHKFQFPQQKQKNWTCDMKRTAQRCRFFWGLGRPFKIIWVWCLWALVVTSTPGVAHGGNVPANPSPPNKLGEEVENMWAKMMFFYWFGMETDLVENSAQMNNLWLASLGLADVSCCVFGPTWKDVKRRCSFLWGRVLSKGHLNSLQTIWYSYAFNSKWVPASHSAETSPYAVLKHLDDENTILKCDMTCQQTCFSVFIFNLVFAWLCQPKMTTCQLEVAMGLLFLYGPEPWPKTSTELGQNILPKGNHPVQQAKMGRQRNTIDFSWSGSLVTSPPKRQQP